MRITLTIEGLNEKEARRVLSQIAEQRSDKDLPADKGVGETTYIPSCSRTQLALDALLKCQRVKLLRPGILESWATAFIHVDLANEIAKAEAWAQSKDVKRSPKGWAKALNSWLGKAQDKARGSGLVLTVHPGGGKTLGPAPVDPAVDAWAKAAE